MSNYTEMLPYLEHSDYNHHFWNAMRGKRDSYDHMSKGRNIAIGSYAMAPISDDKYMKALAKESLFRQISTTIKAYGSGFRIRAKDTKDVAMFVPEGGEIPMQDGMKDFTIKNVDNHKLLVFIKTDEEFIRDVTFDFEQHLTERFAKNFGRAEDNGFINGTGVNMPTGILAENGGAEVGVTTDALTYDDVVKLFFSVKPEYRKHGIWLMNDETALVLRTLKDDSGNYIWNHTNDTILGKKVIVSEFMPSAQSGSKPIAFGDFSYYWVIGRSPIFVRTIQEKFVLMDQIGHLATMFLDGKLVRPEAIKVMQMTA